MAATPLEDCQSRSVEDCNEPCVLEYQATGQNPTCVPPVGYLNSETLTNDEVDLVRRIMIRLLPEADSASVRDAFNTLHAPLYGYVVEKIKADVRGSENTSWINTCQKIQKTIHDTLHQWRCVICLEDLNNPTDTRLIQIMSCCGLVSHLRCLQKHRRLMFQAPVRDPIWNTLAPDPACPVCRDTESILRLVPAPDLYPPLHAPDASAAIQPPVVSSPPDVPHPLDVPRHVLIAMYAVTTYSLLYKFLFPRLNDQIASRVDEVYRLLDEEI